MSRLILFDIDGTLMSAGPSPKRAFRRALEDVFGTTGPIDSHDFAGKTDPQIARELMRAAGLDDAEIDPLLPALFEAYLAELALELAGDDYAPMVHPGVRELLDALEAHPHQPLVGLLTGNVEKGAALKLGSVGLQERFRMGAYGSDSERRHELPALAVARARAVGGREFRGAQVVVVGDTPHDVSCGRSLGVFALSVATGPFGADELRQAGADLVLEDLGDTSRVLDALLGERIVASARGRP
ncbi:MAG TPA: HAD hydrolase-like protein [Longimicrobiales bacterium]|nr:HAD hydrolase-like protein [Longimicrobiales bacterium]